MSNIIIIIFYNHIVQYSILFIGGSNFSMGQSAAPQMFTSTWCNLGISSYILCCVCNTFIYSYGELYKSVIQELNEDTEKNFSDNESEEIKYLINRSYFGVVCWKWEHTLYYFGSRDKWIIRYWERIDKVA